MVGPAVNTNVKHQKTLGNILRFFTGVEVTVELKNGQIWRGTLVSADTADLSVTLEVHQDDDDAATVLFQLVHIRGSKILYLHFPPDLALFQVVKQGVERERAAAQKYKRGIRKEKKS